MFGDVATATHASLVCSIYLAAAATAPAICAKPVRHRLWFQQFATATTSTHRISHSRGVYCARGCREHSETYVMERCERKVTTLVEVSKILHEIRELASVSKTAPHRLHVRCRRCRLPTVIRAAAAEAEAAPALTGGGAERSGVGGSASCTCAVGDGDLEGGAEDVWDCAELKDSMSCSTCSRKCRTSSSLLFDTSASLSLACFTSATKARLSASSSRSRVCASDSADCVVSCLLSAACRCRCVSLSLAVSSRTFPSVSPPGTAKDEQRGPRTAPKGTKLPPSSNPAAACRPARPPRAPRMRAAPPQLHRRRRMTAARPAGAAQERWWAPDATLRRQLSHEPYRSAPPPLRLRAVRSARTAVRRAGGRVAASVPPPAGWGPTASSSVVATPRRVGVVTRSGTAVYAEHIGVLEFSTIL